MTLSRWLRDYLYIPLGGNRGGTLLTYRNLMLTMLIGGLWHGAGWTFVVWGGIHGTALCVERWWRGRPGFVERPWTHGAPGLAPVRDLPGRLLRVDLLSRRLVRGRLGPRPAAVHGVGRALAARHRGVARGDRGRDRLPVPPETPAAADHGAVLPPPDPGTGGRSLVRASSSSTRWGPKAWHRSSTSSSDGDSRHAPPQARARAPRTEDAVCTRPGRRSSSRSSGSRSRSS